MKTNISALFAVGMVAAMPPLAPVRAKPVEPAPAHAHPVTYAERTSSSTVTRGTWRHHVERALGQPDLRLGDDVWIYHRFGTPSPSDCRAGCDRLVITFAAGKVAGLQLVNAPTEKIHVARLRARPQEPAATVAAR